MLLLSKHFFIIVLRTERSSKIHVLLHEELWCFTRKAEGVHFDICSALSGTKTRQHSACCSESACQRQSYASQMPRTDQTAIAAYEKTLRDTLIYKNAESFCRVRIIA